MVLGVWISTDPTVTLNLNYTEKLEQIRNLLSCWKYRRLTLIGKIQVLKSFALSQLTYISTPMATNQRFIGEINNIFYSFLWNNKGDKIKRTLLISNYDHGGLKKVDLSSFNKSLKTTWIVRKYLDTSNHGQWKEFVELDLEKYGGNLIFRGNLNKSDSLKTISVKTTLQESCQKYGLKSILKKLLKPRNIFLSNPYGTIR